MTRFPGILYPDNHYLLAVGEAVFHYGLLEIGVVHFIDCKQPGFHANSYDMTAVPIMQKLRELAEVERDEQLQKLGEASYKLAILRNILLHARPVADEGQQPLLGYAGREGVHHFSLDDIQRFSKLCGPVLSFFSNWAIQVTDGRRQLTDFEEFEKQITPLMEKWKRRAERRR